MTFTDGAKDGYHYWLTPPELFNNLCKEFNFDFDPCPYPKPESFDGLSCDWGASNYVNPPFGVVIHNGKKKGATAWIRKAIQEHQKGETVVLVYPIDKWILMMIEAGAEIRNLKDVRWHSIEENKPGNGTGRHIACFVLKSNPSQKNTTINNFSTSDLVEELCKRESVKKIIVSNNEKIGFCYITNGNQRSEKILGMAKILVIKE